jgi:hypothetical protein
LALAAKYGLRVLSPNEIGGLFDESENFKNSLKPERYWTVDYMSDEDYAWVFHGDEGGVSDIPSMCDCCVRCIYEGK